MKYSINDFKTVVFHLIIFSPISILIQGIPILNNINKIFICLLIIFLLLILIKDKFQKNEVFLVFFGLTSWIFSVIYINTNYLKFNDIFYLILWILLFLFLSKHFREFVIFLYNNSKKIKSVIFIWLFLVLFSFLFNSSYYSEWGTDLYFKSFADNAFRFAGTGLFVTVLICLYSKISNNKKILILNGFTLYFVAQSGSRTYLLLLLLFIMFYFFENVNKKAILFIFPIICIGGFVLLSNSNIVNKINYVSYSGKVNNKSILATVTSGRTDFWLIDIQAYNELNIFNKFVGNGITYSIQVNSEKYNFSIQAHNDYLNILLGYGILGLISYLGLFIHFIKNLKNNFKIKKIALIYFLVLYFFNAFFNGVLYYTIATLVLPLMICAMGEKKLEVDYEKNTTN